MFLNRFASASRFVIIVSTVSAFGGCAAQLQPELINEDAPSSLAVLVTWPGVAYSSAPEVGVGWGSKYGVMGVAGGYSSFSGGSAFGVGPQGQWAMAVNKGRTVDIVGQIDLRWYSVDVDGKSASQSGVAFGLGLRAWVTPRFGVTSFLQARKLSKVAPGRDDGHIGGALGVISLF